MIEAIQERELRGDAELARKLRAEFAAGRPTRRCFEVDNLWAICRRCVHYRGDRCLETELNPDGPNLLDLLTHSDLYCQRWPSRSPDHPVTPSPPDPVGKRKAEGGRGKGATLPATSTSEAMLDRMHQQGPRRSQAERKAARRAARKGAKAQR